MSQLLGVAFSSPAVVPLLIDNTHFLVHTYSGRKGAFKDYLAVQEDRDKVVLVPTVRKLVQAHELDEDQDVRVFMLFDRADILSQISGCTIIDSVPNEADPGAWTVAPEKVTRERLNEILTEATTKDVAFTIPTDVAQQAALLEPSLFDFIGQILRSIPKEPLPKDESEEEEADDFIYDPEEFAKVFTRDTAAWVCGINHARLWIIRHKKRTIKLGADEELVLDLYRFCNEGTAAQNLWKAYHAALGGLTLEEAIEKYEAHPGDLKRCVEMFPLEEERTYKRVPEDEEADEE